MVVDRTRFYPGMAPEAVFWEVENLATEWAESFGNYSDAIMIAKLMPNSLRWFDRNVPIVELPKQMIRKIENILDDFNIGLPDKPNDCCVSGPGWDWQYCPVCGEQIVAPTVESIFEREHQVVVGFRRAARTEIELRFGSHSSKSGAL
jgi:hypothetical protein